MTVESNEALAVIAECKSCQPRLRLRLQMYRIHGEAVMNVSICKAMS